MLKKQIIHLLILVSEWELKAWMHSGLWYCSRFSPTPVLRPSAWDHCRGSSFLSCVLLSFSSYNTLTTTYAFTIALSRSLSSLLSLDRPGDTGSHPLIDRFPSGALSREPGNRSSRTIQQFALSRGGLGAGEMMDVIKTGSFGGGDTTLIWCFCVCVSSHSDALCVSHTLILF